MPESRLVSLGYEGRSVNDVVAELIRESVTVLVDVRLTPLSRKPGLSKRKLAEALEAAGIRYVHLRALGNPKDNRAQFRAGDPRSHAVFRRLIAAGEGAQALRRVAQLLDHHTVALLCYERDHHACHRGLIAAELQRAEPALDVVQL
ncbi:MAG TPA: DUF488 domain-containing protein [Jatrophihabitans sp.]|jgi:uncharacterized protein (DUF488 family)|uniref:DUF488 domain-containing protein n=1 Tax=Jatrophihabitans sp. TaxID=1932789 RepID=UPI002EFA549F